MNDNELYTLEQRSAMDEEGARTRAEMNGYHAVETDDGTRHIILTPASDIKPRPVRWLWKNRLALGTIGLLSGKAGVGKSTLAYWIAAQLTRGDLYGIYEGLPKSVLVCAAEDSWEHTIVPRLIAADADLTRIFRVDVISAVNTHVGLTLPRDLDEVEKSAINTDSALMLLDPLMSRLGKLDTHKDAEVRQALEPLMDVVDRVRMSVLGLIHHNKSGSTDPLQLVMGSAAFGAVSRSVHTVIRDPDDDTGQRRLFGTPKNNLGRDDLPTFSFTISGHPVDTEEGTAWTGRIEWGEQQTASIEDAMARSMDMGEDRSAVGEAADWLVDYVSSKGGQVPCSDAKKAGRAGGHSEASIKRARARLNLIVSSSGFPRATFWELPPEADSSGRARAGGRAVEPTEPTGLSVGESSSTSSSSSSSRTAQSAQSAHGSTPPAREPNEPAVWEQTTLGHHGKATP